MQSSLSLSSTAPSVEAPLVADAQEARELWASFRQHSRSFSFAARLLPRRVQLPIATLYLYCRSIDTIADERVREIGAEKAIAEVHCMRDALEATLQGHPPSEELWQRLAWVHEHFRLDKGALFELTDGALWDLTGRTVETEADLITYSNYVGGCVGVMMLPFLVRNASERQVLEEPARALGIAMQITNISRDVGEDLRLLQRRYIPQSWMSAYEISETDLLKATPPAGYGALMERMMQTAERYYQTSVTGIDALPFRMQLGIRSAARIYREILNEVRANGYDNLSQRAYTTFWRKSRLIVLDRYERRRTALLHTLNNLP